MDIVRVSATGPRALGLLAIVAVVYYFATGVGFSRTCGELDTVADGIKTQITAGEMRRMVKSIHGKSTADLVADAAMGERVDRLHVSIDDLVCADTVALGVVCKVNYSLGTAEEDKSSGEDYFLLQHSGRSTSLLSLRGLRKMLFGLSPRHCSLRGPTP